MASAKPSSLVDTRVIYCGDNLEQLQKLPAACVDLIYIDPPFNSNRNYEVFWGETKEKRSFEDQHENGSPTPARALSVPGTACAKAISWHTWSRFIGLSRLASRLQKNPSRIHPPDATDFGIDPVNPPAKLCVHDATPPD